MLTHPSSAGGRFPSLFEERGGISLLADEWISIGKKFVYPDPKGSELIVPAPFRAGVNRDNQFAKSE
jgi:hypothetical protein